MEGPGGKSWAMSKEGNKVEEEEAEEGTGGSCGDDNMNRLNLMMVAVAES